MTKLGIDYLHSGNILIGNGHTSWWFDPKREDPNNPTHYAGPIPVEEVRRRLFGWPALESVDLTATVTFPDGTTRCIDIAGYKAIVRGDNGDVLNIASADYEIHQYAGVLLDITSNIVGDTLVIDSAGLLKYGAVGWVQVSITEDIHNHEAGFSFRPLLLGATSLDSSMATIWKRVSRFVECDNTFDMAMLESDAGVFRRRHTSRSLKNIIGDARAALGIVERMGDEMDEAITDMIRTEVTRRHFEMWMDALVPIPEIEPGKRQTAVTKAENKRDKLITMWTSDPRVAPWSGTKLGALQLVNTYSQHESLLYGADDFEGGKTGLRVERTMMNVLSRTQAKSDGNAMVLLDKVLEMA